MHFDYCLSVLRVLDDYCWLIDVVCSKSVFGERWSAVKAPFPSTRLSSTWVWALPKRRVLRVLCRHISLARHGVMIVVFTVITTIKKGCWLLLCCYSIDCLLLFPVWFHGNIWTLELICDSVVACWWKRQQHWQHRFIIKTSTTLTTTTTTRTTTTVNVWIQWNICFQLGLATYVWIPSDRSRAWTCLCRSASHALFLLRFWLLESDVWFMYIC